MNNNNLYSNPPNTQMSDFNNNPTNRGDAGTATNEHFNKVFDTIDPESMDNIDNTFFRMDGVPNFPNYVDEESLNSQQYHYKPNVYVDGGHYDDGYGNRREIITTHQGSDSEATLNFANDKNVDNFNQNEGKDKRFVRKNVLLSSNNEIIRSTHLDQMNEYATPDNFGLEFNEMNQMIQNAPVKQEWTQVDNVRYTHHQIPIQDVRITNERTMINPPQNKSSYTGSSGITSENAVKFPDQDNSDEKGDVKLTNEKTSLKSQSSNMTINFDSMNQEETSIVDHIRAMENDLFNLRKNKKTFMAKQRQLKKNNACLSDLDQSELARISDIIANLSKQCDNFRKQHKNVVNKFNIKKGSLGKDTGESRRKKSKTCHSMDQNYMHVDDRNASESQKMCNVINPQETRNVQHSQKIHEKKSQENAHQDKYQQQPPGHNQTSRNQPMYRNEGYSNETSVYRPNININDYHVPRQALMAQRGNFYPRMQQNMQRYPPPSMQRQSQPHQKRLPNLDQLGHQPEKKGNKRDFETFTGYNKSNQNHKLQSNNESPMQKNAFYTVRNEFIKERGSEQQRPRMNYSHQNQMMRNIPHKIMQKLNTHKEKVTGKSSSSTNEAIKQLLNATDSDRCNKNENVNVNVNVKKDIINNNNINNIRRSNEISNRIKQETPPLTPADVQELNFTMELNKTIALKNHRLCVHPGQILFEPAISSNNAKFLFSEGKITEMGGSLGKSLFNSVPSSFEEVFGSLKDKNYHTYKTPTSRIFFQSDVDFEGANMAVANVNNTVAMISQQSDRNVPSLPRSKNVVQDTRNVEPPGSQQDSNVILTLNPQASENTESFLQVLCKLLNVTMPLYFDKENKCANGYSHKERIFVVEGFKSGAANNRFCQTCDLVLNHAVIYQTLKQIYQAAQISLPVVVGEEECTLQNEKLESKVYFCSATCRMQFEMSPTREKLNDLYNAEDVKCLVVKKDSIQNVKVNSKSIFGPVLTRKSNLEERRMKCSNLIPTMSNSYNRKTFVIYTDKSIYDMAHVAAYNLDTILRSCTVGDSRKCILCGKTGDGKSEKTERLLNLNANRFVHLNCAFWSQSFKERSEAMENLYVQTEQDGSVIEDASFMKINLNFTQLPETSCNVCENEHAHLVCCQPACCKNYHVYCAVSMGCKFYTNGAFSCPEHFFDGGTLLTSLAVRHRSVINRDEHVQFASVFQQGNLSTVARIGATIYYSLGKLTVEQAKSKHFNTGDFIYPVNYQITRFYWSFRRSLKRAKYTCTIVNDDGKPEFVLTVHEPQLEDVTFRANSAKIVWDIVSKKVNSLRTSIDLLKVQMASIDGQNMYGLCEPAVTRVLESLAGMDQLEGYSFKYGHFPSVTATFTVNPSGCARSEPGLHSLNIRRNHTLSSSIIRAMPKRMSNYSEIPYSYILDDFDMMLCDSKEERYRKMKPIWRDNVYLRRSKIQGLGLYAARDLDVNEMIIEYVGELIRNVVCDKREGIYTKEKRGIYMFRSTDDVVIDATLCGGPSRYINHSCDPNCYADTIGTGIEAKVVIISNKQISANEELTYDYKLNDDGDENNRMMCGCGSKRCTGFI